MQITGCGAGALALGVFLAVSTSAGLAQSCVTPSNASTMLGQLRTQVNAQRSQAGLGALSAHAGLAQAAQSLACDNARRNQISHTGANGSTLGSRLRGVGYSFASANENVTMGHSSAAGAVQAWMGSGPHRANILERGTQHFGGGVATGPGGQLFWVMVSARPR